MSTEVAEAALIELYEADLPDGGGGLLLPHAVAGVLPAEAVGADGDRARGDEHDLAPILHQGGDVAGERGEPVGLELSVAGEGARSDLHDDPLRSGDELPGSRLRHRAAPSCSRSFSSVRSASTASKTSCSNPSRPWWPPRRSVAPGFPGRELLLEVGDQRIVVDEVALAEHHDLLAVEQLGPVAPELPSDRVVVVDEVPTEREHGFEIEQVDQHPRALDVSEKLMTEACSVARAFDQPRDVRHDDPLVVPLDHAERGDEGREGIICDAGTRGGDPPEQRRLARVGETDETDVRHQLERQAQAPALARLAGGREIGGLPSGGLEARVPEPASATA